MFRILRNISDKFLENIKNAFHMLQFFFGNRALYEIKWKSCGENQSTYCSFSSLFSKSVKKKYSGAWEATDDNMAHALCMPDS